MPVAAAAVLVLGVGVVGACTALDLSKLRIQVMRACQRRIGASLPPLTRVYKEIPDIISPGDWQ